MIEIGGNVTVVAIDAAGLYRQRVHNVTCVGGHEAIAGALVGGSVMVEALALGNAGDAGTSTQDRTLNNELTRVPVTSQSITDTTARYRTFVPPLLQIGSSGDPVDEIGVTVTTSDLLNHATIQPVDLSGTDTTLVVEIEITVANT